MMEDYLQTEWPDLNVWLTSTTEQWAVIAVQGPKARARAGTDWWTSTSARAPCPHMSVATRHICGVPMRLFRVSFTGELGFEVNVPADFGPAVWERIWDAGQAYGITAYGTETMHVLRAEKGYIIVGQDTDGTVTPDDAGLAWAIGKSKPDFVGKRSLQRPAMSSAARRQLVGLLTPIRTACSRKARRSWRQRQRRADAPARSRHLVLLQRRARPLDRAGAGRRRPRAPRPDPVRAHARRRAAGPGDLRRCSTTRRGAPQCLTSTAARRAPRSAAAPRCARCRRRRASCCAARRGAGRRGAALGVALPASPCRAERGRARRAVARTGRVAADLPRGRKRRHSPRSWAAHCRGCRTRWST